MVSKAKRLIFVSALAISIVGAGMYSARDAFAQDSTVQSTLVSKIAQKFSLKTEDVQAVFDQQRQERMAQFEAKYEQHLSDEVTAGNITQSQKALILAKHKEIESEKTASADSMKSLSPAERRTAMATKKAELKKWADANGIDLKYLAGMGRFGHGKLK